MACGVYGIRNLRGKAVTREDVWVFCLRKHYSAAYAQYWMSHTICEACRAEESGPPHHARTRGAGGDDEPENLLALGLACHRAIHTVGRESFCAEYPHLRRKIDAALERSRV